MAALLWDPKETRPAPLQQRFRAGGSPLILSPLAEEEEGGQRGGARGRERGGVKFLTRELAIPSPGNLQLAMVASACHKQV